MNSGILVKDIDLMCKEIYEKFNVIKQIDFNEDIDIDMSDRYEINEDKGYLEFLFKEVEKIETNDLTPLIGKVESEYGSINIISTDYVKPEISYLSASVIIEKKMQQNDIDIIYIEFEKNKEFIFYFMICNSVFFNTMQKIKNKELEYEPESFNNQRWETINSVFRDDNLTISKQIAKKLNENSSTTLSLKKYCNRKYLINIKKNYVVVDNEKKQKLNVFGDIKNKDISLHLMVQNIQTLSGIKAISLKSLIYAKEDGYIYPKPIDNPYKQIQIFMMFSGEPEIQYYSHNKDKWIKIKNGEKIDTSNNLRFRFKMKTSDKIYKILLANGR